MTDPNRSSDFANAWSDIHRARPDEVSELAYYRFVARRLRKANETARRG